MISAFLEEVQFGRAEIGEASPERGSKALEQLSLKDPK